MIVMSKNVDNDRVVDEELAKYNEELAKFPLPRPTPQHDAKSGGKRHHMQAKVQWASTKQYVMDKLMGIASVEDQDEGAWARARFHR